MGLTGRVALAAIVAVALSVAVGAGGFSAANADRSVTVDVVDDDDAYMALDYPSDARRLSVTDARTETVLTVRNQFTVTVDTTVEATVDSSDGLTVTLDEPTAEPIDPGESVPVEATFDCRTNGTYAATISVDARVDGEGTSVSAETTSQRVVEFDPIECSTS